MKQITFIDEARIKVKGGNGGDGAKIFHTEKFVRQGGPSGGNGGDGGNIILKASYNENTLLDFRGRSQYIGHPGIRGGRQNLTGARGKNKVILVPVGTKVFDNKIQVADLGAEGMIFVAGTGGKGGRGNQSFKSSTNTAPSMYEQGEVTEFEEYQLELTVLADVGLLGFPNAGKSTFLSVVSNAKPKIASYEFTTLVPQLGVVKHKGQKYVVTDLPGLIEGAAENKGMGHQFLKHLSRTKVVLHLVDATQSDVMFRYNTLRKELANFDTNMAKLPEIIALNKVDELDEEQITELKAMFNDKKVFFISALTGAGVELLHDEVIEQIQVWQNAEDKRLDELSDDFAYITLDDDDDDVLKIREINGVWTISNRYTRYWAKRIPMDNSDNIARIFKKFQTKGIFKRLQREGLKDGDWVVVDGTPFQFEYYE